MRDIFNISKLLIKKRLKVLSKNEKENLAQLQKKYPFGKDVDYPKIIHKIESYDAIDNEKAWKSITKKEKSRNSTAIIPLRLRGILKYAAIFIGITAIGTAIYLSQNSSFYSEEESPITLQLENGDIKIIPVNGEQKIVNEKGQLIGTRKGNQLYYEKETDFKELVYNELFVPYGKRFNLELSDGTRVHLNSGTSIKYPVKFIEGKDRQVFLTGEAYFDVAKDTLHPFIVNADAIDIRVLGTKFNISSYPEDNSVNTVLIEGLVSLHQKSNTGTSSILNPGYKATWNKTEKHISIKKVNPEIYIGWIEGKLIFKDVYFEEIIKKLERHYNVTIKNYNAELNYEKFDAVFDIETIEDVLNSFNESHPVKFNIENDHIIIY